MTAENLVEKYIKNTQEAFRQMRERDNAQRGEAEKILDYAKKYLDDAIYYRDEKSFETALVSIVYCEGLLDALKLLGMVKFQWSTENI